MAFEKKLKDMGLVGRGRGCIAGWKGEGLHCRLEGEGLHCRHIF